MNRKLLTIFLIILLILISFFFIRRDIISKTNSEDTKTVSKNNDNTSTIVPFIVPLRQEDLNNNQSLLAPEEELIANFFGMINNQQITEAITLMSPRAVPDAASKQAWGVQFNAMKLVNVMGMEAVSQDTWTDKTKVYKVTLEIYVDQSAANEPIPYYGYGDNPNIRFITVWKGDNDRWYIDQIGTGP
jgi:hypothetical protein